LLRKGIHPNVFLQRSWDNHGEKNFKFEVLEEYPSEILYSMEHYWCNVLDTRNQNFGYNLHGTSNDGKPHLTHDEISKRTSTRKKNALERGYWVSEERILKMKESMRGKPVDSKMVENSIAVTSVSVNQFSKDGELIATYKSQSEAERMTGINSKNISLVCSGRRKTAGGFVWKICE
jgi:hypothetical protein